MNIILVSQNGKECFQVRIEQVLSLGYCLHRWLLSLQLVHPGMFYSKYKDTVSEVTAFGLPTVSEVLWVCQRAVCMAPLLLVFDQRGHPVSKGFPAPAS